MSRLVFDFFHMLWFYNALVVANVIWIAVRRTKLLVTSGAVTAQERRRFLAGFIGFVLVIVGCQVGFALATRNRNPVCVSSGYADPVVNGVVITTVAVLLGWLWLGHGAAVLARFAPAFLNERKTYTARHVWRAVALLGLVFAAVSAPMDRWYQSVQTTLCTEQRRPTDPAQQWRWWRWQNRREA